MTKWEFRLIYTSLLIIGTSFPLLTFINGILPPELISKWTVFSVPKTSVNPQIRPPLRPEFDFSIWANRTIFSIIVAAVTWLGVLSFIATFIGVIMLAVAMIVFQHPKGLVRIGYRIIQKSRVKLLLICYAIVGTPIIFPPLFRIFVEIFIFLTIVIPTVTMLGLGWYRLRDSQDLLMRVGLMYPMGLSIIPLPIVMFALTSPTTSPVMRKATLYVSVFILDNILFVGGVNGWLRETFTLSGINFVAVWAGIIFTVGWTFGVAIESKGKQIYNRVSG